MDRVVAESLVDSQPDTGRGAASRRIEEAQLRLALELSKNEADSGQQNAATSQPNPNKTDPPACAEDPQSQSPAKDEPVGIVLRGEGHDVPTLMVFLKDHCVASRVEELPESLERSIEHIVRKMTKPKTWGLLYDSITEELAFRCKCAAQALRASHSAVMAHLLGLNISLKQERVCLPIWRSSAKIMTDLSKLRASNNNSAFCESLCNVLRQASVEWCDMEDLTEFMDDQLAPLETAIDNFRGASEASSGAHTPHVRDVGRLMFRNFCLLDSHVFRPLCLAAYALVHEAKAVQGERHRNNIVEVLEGFHAMLVSCDVADDHLSASKNTKDAFEENLVSPISAAIEQLGDWDIRGQASRQLP